MSKRSRSIGHEAFGSEQYTVNRRSATIHGIWRRSDSATTLVVIANGVRHVPMIVRRRICTRVPIRYRREAINWFIGNVRRMLSTITYGLSVRLLNRLLLSEGSRMALMIVYGGYRHCQKGYICFGRAISRAGRIIQILLILLAHVTRTRQCLITFAPDISSNTDRL